MTRNFIFNNSKLRQLAEDMRLIINFSYSRKSPKWGSIFVTKSCNLACKYCQVPTKNPMPDLPTREWKEIIKKLAHWGVNATTIVGGEPTLREDLPELVSCMRENGILPCLISNFATMDNRMIYNLGKAGLFSLQASLDSLKGSGRGDRSWLDLLKYAGNIGILPLVSTLISHQNVDEIPSIAETVTNHGIIFNCGLYQEVNGAFSVLVDGNKPPMNELSSTLHLVEAIKRRTGLIRTTYNYLRNIDKYYYGSNWHCNSEKDYWVNVNADGTMMPCQEYESSIYALDIQSLEDAKWKEERKTIRSACKGCYYQCYFEQEVPMMVTAVNEARQIFTAWRLLRHNLPTNAVLPFVSNIHRGSVSSGAGNNYLPEGHFRR